MCARTITSNWKKKTKKKRDNLKKRVIKYGYYMKKRELAVRSKENLNT